MEGNGGHHPGLQRKTLSLKKKKKVKVQFKDGSARSILVQRYHKLALVMNW